MILIYYFLYSFAIIGYGIIFTKIFGLKARNFGFFGFYGLSFLTFLSYITAPFFVHNFIFNMIILFSGLFFFIFVNKEKINIRQNLIFHITIFFILIIFIASAKTHDDYPYYHFPYSYLLTQMEHPIGLGHVNPGFRNASSLFFLNSLFYLPGTGIYLMNIYPVFFLGFANQIFINLVLNKKNYSIFKFSNFLALISLAFLNTFFYRIAEHGVDRSGMIIVFIIITVSALILKNINTEKIFKDNLDLFFFISILLALLASLKSIYLLYVPIGGIFLFFWKRKIFTIIKNPIIIYSVLFVVVYLLYNFLNSGCIVYPADFICFYDLEWSLNRELILNDNEWFELWSKAGASPNYVVEDKQFYIKDLNWFVNWINNYFFNKVSDYLLGLFFLIIIFYFIFFKNYQKNNSNKFELQKFLILYFFIIIIFLEWFFKHPQLRYGGYHLIALIVFMPLSYVFNSFSINFSNFLRKSKIIIILVLVIYSGRNIDRLISEHSVYKYNPFISFNYYHGEELFRYMSFINENKQNEKFKKINFFGKDFLITKPQKLE